MKDDWLNEIDEKVIEMEQRRASSTRRKRIMSLDEIMETDFVEPNWVIPGILPPGLSILGGRPKLGKSWMFLNIGLALRTGGKALGRYDVECGDVLYLALEDNFRRIKARVNRMVDDYRGEGCFDLIEFGGIARINEGGLDAVLEWKEKVNNPKAVFIDTWARWKPKKAVQGSYEGDYDDTAKLQEATLESGLAALIATHTRKAEAQDVVEEITGTLGTVAGADNVMVLKRKTGQVDGALHIVGRDVEEQELALSWDKERCLWTAMGDLSQYQQTTERAAVIRELAGTDGLTKSEIQDRLGKSRKDTGVKQILNRLSKTGEAYYDESDKRWKLCDADTA